MGAFYVAQVISIEARAGAQADDGAQLAALEGRTLAQSHTSDRCLLGAGVAGAHLSIALDQSGRRIEVARVRCGRDLAKSTPIVVEGPGLNFVDDGRAEVVDGGKGHRVAS